MVKESNLVDIAPSIRLQSHQNTNFRISASSLQDLLKNITISMLTLNQTTMKITTTQNKLVNIFAFTYPFNLILPYFISLLASLAFIITGALALYANGVPASSNSFFQILCTTRGSHAVDVAAAQACLGGPDNVPEPLKDMEVVFGELEPSLDCNFRRAGFGIPSEVSPLIKHQPYGK